MFTNMLNKLMWLFRRRRYVVKATNQQDDTVSYLYDMVRLGGLRGADLFKTDHEAQEAAISLRTTLTWYKFEVVAIDTFNTASFTIGTQVKLSGDTSC